MMTDLVKRLRNEVDLTIYKDDPFTVDLKEAADLIEQQAKEIERLKASERSAWNAAVVRDEEIARLKAGGCARDQGLTQYCAEAAGMAQEIERLHQRELNAKCVHCGGVIFVVADEWDKAQAEIERLRKDAERYRWLRCRGADVSRPRFGGTCYIFAYGDKMDRFIDAALKDAP